MPRSICSPAIVPLLLLFQTPISCAQDTAAGAEKGQIVGKNHRYGTYIQYVPRQESRGVLVIAHGMPSGDDIHDIPGLARRFLKRWTDFSEAHGLIAIAPVFDAENFDSVVGREHGGGYRALFGRMVGADSFVNQIVAQYKPRIRSWDGRIVLYGHSAGAQFAAHFCVNHPERIRAVVLSACGGYAFPNAGVRWPRGMGPWRTTFHWDGSSAAQSIDVRPDPPGWARAAAVPIMVVVGSQDTEPLKPRAGHAGTTRVEYARQWVEDMNRHARSWRKEGKVGLTIVEGVGHDSAKLTPTAQMFLAGVLSAESREVEAPMRARAAAPIAGQSIPPWDSLLARDWPQVTAESAPRTSGASGIIGSVRS
jgi:pimeloyl-ACP methyl ester carboxylesterase